MYIKENSMTIYIHMAEPPLSSRIKQRLMLLFSFGYTSFAREVEMGAANCEGARVVIAQVYTIVIEVNTKAFSKILCHFT